jgi:cytochrome P450
MVFISEPGIIQEAMISQGSVFMERPHFESLKIITDGFRTLAFGGGERHRFLRKMMVSEVLSNKRVLGFRPIREKEIEMLVETLKNQLSNADNKGAVVKTFRVLIRQAVCNLIAVVLIGRRLTFEEYADIDDIMLKRFKLATGRPRDFMPWLTWLPDSRKAVKFQEDIRTKMTQVLSPLIEERKQALKSGQTEHASYVDTLLNVKDGKIQSPVEILDTDIELTCSEIFSTGVDTTALNLEYCLANLINDSKIQEKLAREISTVVGEKVVSEDDISRLPYLQAVVEESLRRHSPARLAPPRRAVQATKLAGYDIPKDTLVQQHLEGLALRSQLWEDPLVFRPERHHNKSLDVTGTTEITMVPFGVGRRICPAINIAFLHAELILARLIQKFEWKSATPGQLLDVTAAEGFSSAMRDPLVAVLKERLKV